LVPPQGLNDDVGVVESQQPRQYGRAAGARYAPLVILIGLVCGGCAKKAPDVPITLAQSLGLRVIHHTTPGRQRVVVVSAEAVEIPLVPKLFEKTSGRIHPVIPWPELHHIVIATSTTASEQGKRRVHHFLLRRTTNMLELVCAWPGSEHQRNSKLRTLLRTSSFAWDEDAKSTTLTIEQLDYNREFDGHQERIVTRATIAPKGMCKKTIVTQHSNKPVAAGAGSARR
jgi:hypothetical protein